MVFIGRCHPVPLASTSGTSLRGAFGPGVRAEAGAGAWGLGVRIYIDALLPCQSRSHCLPPAPPWDGHWGREWKRGRRREWKGGQDWGQDWEREWGALGLGWASLLQLQPVSPLCIAVLFAPPCAELFVVAETGLFGLASLLGASPHLGLAIWSQLGIGWRQRWISGARIYDSGTIRGWGGGDGGDGGDGGGCRDGGGSGSG